MKAPNKLAALCVATLASFTCHLAGQTPAPAATPESQKCEKAGKPAGHKLLQALNLTDEQKAKVAPILAKAKSDAKAIRADQSLSKKQRRAQLEAIRTNTEQQLQTVLTPEQFQKFQQLRAERKAAHGKGGDAPVPAA